MFSVVGLYLQALLYKYILTIPSSSCRSDGVRTMDVSLASKFHPYGRQRPIRRPNRPSAHPHFYLQINLTHSRFLDCPLRCPSRCHYCQLRPPLHRTRPVRPPAHAQPLAASRRLQRRLSHNAHTVLREHDEDGWYILSHEDAMKALLLYLFTAHQLVCRMDTCAYNPRHGFTTFLPVTSLLFQAIPYSLLNTRTFPCCIDPTYMHAQ